MKKLAALLTSTAITAPAGGAETEDVLAARDSAAAQAKPEATTSEPRGLTVQRHHPGEAVVGPATQFTGAVTIESLFQAEPPASVGGGLGAFRSGRPHGVAHPSTGPVAGHYRRLRLGAERRPGGEGGAGRRCRLDPVGSPSLAWCVGRSGDVPFRCRRVGRWERRRLDGAGLGRRVAGALRCRSAAEGVRR
jgi:hypothetical protein